MGNWNDLHAIVVLAQGEQTYLKPLARSLSAQAHKTIQRRGQDGQPNRTVELYQFFQIRLQIKKLEPYQSLVFANPKSQIQNRELVLHLAWTAVTVYPPKAGIERHQLPLTLWCIRCWEAKADGLEWMLLTTIEPALYSAVVPVDGYACRWLIEEDHNCLKTGCGIEACQLETAEALMRLAGFLGILAVRFHRLLRNGSHPIECIWRFP